MANTSEIRNGLCINHNGKLCTVVEFQHVKPGKGPAFVRTKLRSLTTGRILAIIGIILNIVMIGYIVWIISILGFDALQNPELLQERLQELQ